MNDELIKEIEEHLKTFETTGEYLAKSDALLIKVHVALQEPTGEQKVSNKGISIPISDWQLQAIASDIERESFDVRTGYSMSPEFCRTIAEMAIKRFESFQQKE